MRSKRILDLAVVLLTAPLTAPVLAALALLVLVCDGRPILFPQWRVGEGRRPFRIWKFRTMTCEPDPRARRVTRLGRHLRQRGLDELPQALNVLTGEMSTVGPRPLTPEDAERLIAAHPPFAARFTMPPGMTGLAQVCQARGAAATAELDARYARERSLGLDLGILARTVWIHLVGKRRGARAIPSP